MADNPGLWDEAPLGQMRRSPSEANAASPLGQLLRRRAADSNLRRPPPNTGQNEPAGISSSVKPVIPSTFARLTRSHRRRRAPQFTVADGSGLNDGCLPTRHSEAKRCATESRATAT